MLDLEVRAGSRPGARRHAGPSTDTADNRGGESRDHPSGRGTEDRARRAVRDADPVAADGRRERAAERLSEMMHILCEEELPTHHPQKWYIIRYACTYLHHPILYHIPSSSTRRLVVGHVNDR